MPIATQPSSGAVRGPAWAWALCALLAPLIALAPIGPTALALGGALAAALVLAAPLAGLYLVVLSVPVQEIVHLPGGLSYTQAAVLLTAGSWGLRTLAHPERRLVAGRLLPLWALLLWALLLSAAFTPFSRTEALKETSRWLVAFLAWLIAVNTVAGWRQLAGLLACLLLAPAATAALGIVQFFSGAGPQSFQIPGAPGFARAFGTIGTPNSFAGYLNMAWPLALALAVASTLVAWRSRRPGGTAGAQRPAGARLWLLAAGLWLITGLLLAGLLASFSRGGWLGALAGAAALALALMRLLGRRGVWVALAGAGLLAGVAALGLAGLLPAVITARFTSILSNVGMFDPATVAVTPENYSVVERMSQMWAGWRMFATHPLTGVGAGNYTLAYPSVGVAPWYGSRGHAHNYYLHIAAEAGAAGLLAYLLLIGGVTAQALLALRRATATIARGAVIGCCGIIGAVAGHNLFENLHVLNLGIQLAGVWATLALIGDRRLGAGQDSVA